MSPAELALLHQIQESELRIMRAVAALNARIDALSANQVKPPVQAYPIPSDRNPLNTGHGHVWERPDGFRMRCGGPGLCRQCTQDKTDYDCQRQAFANSAPKAPPLGSPAS